MGQWGNALIFFILASQKGLEEPIVIPADTIKADEDGRLLILKKISLCETKGELLDTLVVDQLMCSFNDSKCFVFPTYSPSEGNMNPHFAKYIGKSEVDSEVELIFLPLCDGCHFNGYIIDLKNRSIVFVDSIYEAKTGKRSIGAKLKDTYFDSASDVTFSSFYIKRVQSDSHSCGAWLIAGFVGYLLGMKGHENVLTRERIFNLMMLLIEDIDINTKKKKAINVYEKIGDTPKQKAEKIKDADDSFLNIKLGTKKRYVFNDSSDDECGSKKQDLLSSYISTPLKKKTKHSAKVNFADQLSDISGSFNLSDVSNISEISSMNDVTGDDFDNDSDSDSMVRKPIPDLSGLTSDGSFNEQEDETCRSHVEGISSNQCVSAAEMNTYSISNFLSAEEIVHILRNVGDRHTSETIPDGRKENVYCIVSEAGNMLRSAAGKKKIYPDDCGVWAEGRVVKSYFLLNDDDNLKYVVLRDEKICTLKRNSGQKVYENIEPQPPADKLFILTRYYTTLKRESSYKRRISRLDLSSDKQSFAIVEYVGKYPDESVPHGNSKHQETMYTRTNPVTLEKIASLCDGTTPRAVYKKMVFEDSFDAPKNFKQVRNVKYRKTKKENNFGGNKNNLADEVLECLSLVDTHEFVQHWSKSKGKMPNFVCFTEDQRLDLNFFLSQKSQHPIGVDRTFNLGRFYVTALVYKNLRVVRAENSDEHPLFLGPVFIHRDATFEAYNYFFSTVKATLCAKKTIQSFELRLGKDIYIGSDEELALTNAIDSNFPASTRFLCSKHLKDGTLAYMQTKVGVPQKDRTKICKAIFGGDGLVNANDSMDFGEKSKSILVQSSRFPKFTQYFQRKLKPSIEVFVHGPNKVSGVSQWTNNNCESLNHIMKLDANWKVKRTPELIQMLYEITVLHFKDFRRALYGEGNYRLCGKFRKLSIGRDIWRKLDSVERKEKFTKFLQNKMQSKEKSNVIASTYSDFTVPSLDIAKKPGQRSRVRSTKTLKKLSKSLRRKRCRGDSVL